MVQDNYRKIKLLKLLELLRKDSDEQNPITTSVLCGRLEEMGIVCDRRTLSKDIALLNEHGYEIMSTTVGHEKGYYIDDRGFSVPELKILIDPLLDFRISGQMPPSFILLYAGALVNKSVA